MSAPTDIEMKSLRREKRRAKAAYERAWRARYPLVSPAIWLVYAAICFVIAGSGGWPDGIWAVPAGLVTGAFGVFGATQNLKDRDGWEADA